MLDRIKGLLTALFVTPVVCIWRDLMQQPLVMWLFIGWGWLAMLAMLTSAITTFGDFVGSVQAQHL